MPVSPSSPWRPRPVGGALAILGAALVFLGCSGSTGDGGGNPPPPAGSADPTLLPLAPTTAPGTAPNVQAGDSWTDPVSGVRVWRLTDANTPATNGEGHHDYSNGSTQVSRGWGLNQNTHTVLVWADEYWLVDVARGVGLGNWRRPVIEPQADLCWTFSNNPATPQIAFVLDNGTLYRVNTATNQQENAAGFPRDSMGGGDACWLMNSASDDWFSTHMNGTTRAYQVSTGLLASTSGGGEAYLDRNGRYIIQPNESGPTSQIWDPVTDNKDPSTLPNSHFVHGATLRGIAVTHDVDQGGGITPLYTTDLSTGDVVPTFNWPVYSANYHLAGQWIQSETGAAQWILRSPEGGPFGATPAPCNRAICLFRANGVGGIRQLAFHYTSDGASYWHTAKATWSPDGKMVLFSSNRGGTRGDAFLAEVPLR